MKMRNHILRLVSVFFLVLVLGGCGIMTVFSVNYSYYQDKSANSGRFLFSDPDNRLGWITKSTGPSLLLGYIVTTESAPPSIITNKFSTEYTRTIVDGRMIPSGPEILSVTSGSNTYSLYKFSDATQKSFDSPHFMATAIDPLFPDVEFNFTLNSDKTLQFSIVSGSYKVHTSEPLTRFTGTPFETIPGTVVSYPDDYPDYLVPTIGGTLYLYIYSAINVSEGDFTNRFWTELHPVASIPLN